MTWKIISRHLHMTPNGRWVLVEQKNSAGLSEWFALARDPVTGATHVLTDRHGNATPCLTIGAAQSRVNAHRWGHLPLKAAS